MENKLEEISALAANGVADYEIDSPESYRRACARLLMVRRLIHEIQSAFGPIKTKTHAAWKETVSQEKHYLEDAQVVEKILRSRINEWASMEDVDLAAENISYRNDWKFRVTDEALVPREFLTVSETLIRERVRSLGPVIQIPGVEIWQERNVVCEVSNAL